MLIFISIFGVGFTILILSTIFGHDTDVDVDTDLDTDHGGHGPSIFSAKMVALILVGFGAAGFGTRASSDASMFVASMAGIGGAVIVGAIGYLIIRAFYASQVTSTVTDADIIGAQGTLIDAIPEGGRGQVACVIRGREITFVARTRDGASILRGTPVKVTSKTAGVVTVEPLE